MKKLIIPAFALALAAGAPAIAWSHDDQNNTDKHHAQAGQGDGAKPDHGDKTPGNDKTPGDHTPGNDKTPGDHTSGNDKTPGDHTPGNDKTPGDHTPNGPHHNTTSGNSDKNKADERERTRDLNRNGSNSQWNKDLHGDNNNNNNNHNDNDHRGDNNHNDNDHHTSGGVHININLGTYRRAVTSSHHFRIGMYRAPSHYSYRRYSIGERLQPEYYGRDYWLSDFSAYDLVSPPDGYVWVRFGPDALLIDEDTGEVLQVVYGVFI